MEPETTHAFNFDHQVLSFYSCLVVRSQDVTPFMRLRKVPSEFQAVLVCNGFLGLCHLALILRLVLLPCFKFGAPLEKLRERLHSFIASISKRKV